jgi:hypothetical protein
VIATVMGYHDGALSRGRARAQGTYIAEKDCEVQTFTLDVESHDTVKMCKELLGSQVIMAWSRLP